ncbi:Serine/threonine-protein kinase D6PKL2 [Dichanthelium oligosanthes]|uniref:non-specific serine/threonine protein kinase n=1 Tax=Dichanthelium oligosanthes TaxID=888268 RepID=A0A1E5UUH9_9POAL|nr:Serine/threonine-protein kinase D6PKL2 [Dichanthelium oligosanthes]
MPPDGDELLSLSFGSSSDRSRSTVSTATSSSGPLHLPLPPRSATPSAPTTVIPRLGSVALSDIRFLRRLGAGDIGSVYLAEVKQPKEDKPPNAGAGVLVAAKVMDRKELAGRNKEGRARTEREILEAVDHPFLPRLYGVAEGDRWSCLLTEFCPGGDLHVLRQRQPHRRFPEAAVRFYAAEVVAALEYIHMVDIVYRDLKPENVLVRADGHIMLTDFDLSLKCDPTAPTPAHVISDPLSSFAGGRSTASTSCTISSCIVPTVSCFQLFPGRGRNRRRRRWRTKKPSSSNSGNSSSSFPSGGGGLDLEFVAEPVELRSMSFVGTHEYLAPEIVSGEGHGSSVDWWTLGVFVFELLYGVTPFKGYDNETTLANIVARALEFPREPPVSSAARDLVAALLAKDPARRLGATVGAAAIKRHPFFGGVNWALLRCAAPPYVPPPFSLGNVKAGGGGGGDANDADDVSDNDTCPGTPVEFY